MLPELRPEAAAVRAAAVALSLYFGAYSVEINHAPASTSMPANQIEAGQCLVLSSGWQVFDIVLLPALRNAYPAAITSSCSCCRYLACLAGRDDEPFISRASSRSAPIEFEVYAATASTIFAMAMSFKALFAIIGWGGLRWPRRR